MVCTNFWIIICFICVHCQAGAGCEVYCVMKIRKLIRKIVVSLVALMVIALIAVTSFIISRRDHIVQYFLAEANQQIATPIEVAKIDVSLLRNFPHISLVFHDVTVSESYQADPGVLGNAKTVSLSFNLIQVLNKNYQINGIQISDGEVSLKINSAGVPNYRIMKPDSSANAALFHLKDIIASNLSVSFVDETSNYSLKFNLTNGQSDIIQRGQDMDVSLKADLISDEIRVGKRRFISNKQVSLQSDIVIDLNTKFYHITSGQLQIDAGRFELIGQVDATNKQLDFEFGGVNTNFQTLNSLLSSDISKYFREYSSKGNVYFEGAVKGAYGRMRRPAVNVQFGAENASFYHPKYKKQIDKVSLEGFFTTGDYNIQENYQLKIKNFSCTLDQNMLVGQMELTDFDDLKLDLKLAGDVDVNSLLLLFPGNLVKTAFGTIGINLHLNGNITSKHYNNNYKADGDVVLKNISFVLNGERLPFNRINGTLSLRNNDLAVSNLVGEVGQSDFQLNGFLRDVYGLVFKKSKLLKLEADLSSSFIDFDELLKSNFASRDTLAGAKKRYEFAISPHITIDFNCAVDRLKFRKFRATDIEGQLEINHQMAILKNIAFASMGGKINVSGSVNNKNGDLVETITEASLHNISIDSVFCVFNNFRQSWLVDRNLKGQLDADVYAYMNFNKNLVLNPESLMSDIEMSIDHGELNDFEPMMKLSKFVEEESLAQMRFSKMTNNIRIENKVIHLPEMEIVSNISSILIKGEHTFDKAIDYRIQVPLKSLLRISKKPDFEESALKGMNLMLKITGTTSDYSVSYDSQALKESIKDDVLDEGQEWKELRNRKENDDAPELEDEYFDFDEKEDTVKVSGL
jgi:hypothetical protein